MDQFIKNKDANNMIQSNNQLQPSTQINIAPGEIGREDKSKSIMTLNKDETDGD